MLFNVTFFIGERKRMMQKRQKNISSVNIWMVTKQDLLE